MKEQVAIFWFRRDLRIADNTGLSLALHGDYPVLPIFIFDTAILDKLHNKEDKRVDYIHQALLHMQKELQELKSDIRVYYGEPLTVFEELLDEYEVKQVYCNHDYEPYAHKRDKEVSKWLETKDVHFHSSKDQVIFEADEIVKSDGSPYTVYTPYSRRWKERLDDKDYRAKAMHYDNLMKLKNKKMLSLADIGFEKTSFTWKKPKLDPKIIDNYGQHRDYPGEDHTTRLGLALRFGTISVRACVRFGVKHNATWLGELIWREFFMQILYHFPKVVSKCFKAPYEHIAWRNNEEEFTRWCEGRTGYPLVDAGMHELNETGFMHNRVRMVTASFLTKHLLIDWRWGEAYFAEKLLDYELSSNNGNWQWAAGCGCDAAPYFRIFNPMEQTKKFDKNLEYIKRWNPDFEALENEPIVDHKFARERALDAYKKALDKGRN